MKLSHMSSHTLVWSLIYQAAQENTAINTRTFSSLLTYKNLTNNCYEADMLTDNSRWISF